MVIAIIPALGKWRTHQEFKSSLRYIEFMLAWSASDPVLTQTKENNSKRKTTQNKEKV